MSREPETVVGDIPARNTPWIGEFMADDGDSIYFIYIEQTILCSVSSFTRTLFLWFSLYYMFNLEYAKNSKRSKFIFSGVHFLVSPTTHVRGHPRTYPFQLTFRDVQFAKNNIFVSLSPHFLYETVKYL